MKTILVLTDHSYSSFNAARYALTFAGTFDSSKVIFYYSYHYLANAAGELALVSAGLDSLKQINIERMTDLQISLEPFRKPGTVIECLTDERHLLVAATEICREFKVDIILTGSKNRSAAGMLLIGSKIVDLVNKLDIPFLIIPASYIYEPVMCAVLATDLIEVENLPHTSINHFINDYRCKLAVLNVDPHQEEHADTDQIFAIGKLHKLMDAVRPDYHYTNNHDISEGISRFCNEQHAGLVIIIHREHGFLHNLFYKSVEKEMIVHSHIPLLILKPESK